MAACHGGGAHSASCVTTAHSLPQSPFCLQGRRNLDLEGGTKPLRDLNKS